MHKLRGAAAALTAAVVIVLGLGSSGSLLAQEPVARISVAELKKMYDAGTVVVIDVRSAAAYAANHVANAWLVPVDAAAQKAGELKKTGKTVVAYCT